MLKTIEQHCGQFLEQSNGIPLLKNLPITLDGFRKIKVRKKKATNNQELFSVYNEVFEEYHDYNEIMQRSVFAHGPLIDKKEEGLEPFYIFPIDGFRFLYSKDVDNTTQIYKETFDKLLDTLDSSGVGLFKEILKYQYVGIDLYEGLTSKSEIIVYDIPFYYAIRKSLFEDYNKFLEE